LPTVRLGSGVAFALAAGLLWGLVFVAPLMLPQYPATLQSVARYAAFGLLCIPLAWLDRASLRSLTQDDWLEALKLALVGNLMYYTFLASSIQRTGGALSTVIIGTLPVLIALTANNRNRERDGHLPWARLLPTLLLIALGIMLVHHEEWVQAIRQDTSSLRYGIGVLLGIGAAACWTWYPLRNADWLRNHPGRSPRAWATAQGLMTLPLALLGYLVLWVWMTLTEDAFDMPLGPTPGFFIFLMISLGLLASWLGTLCWNEASQRLPTALVGQLIVFETLAALAYTYWWRGDWPTALTALGVGLLLLGVFWALRVKPVHNPS
jgi:drug/metabolite transporter (DMT)-like permease